MNTSPSTKQGDVVTGRIVEVSGRAGARGTGRRNPGHVPHGYGAGAGEGRDKPDRAKADLSSLSSMLQARWKGGAAGGGAPKPEAVHAGQIRSFRIAALDVAAKKIELKLS